MKGTIIGISSFHLLSHYQILQSKRLSDSCGKIYEDFTALIFIG